MKELLGEADTFPKLLARNAERLSGRAALREKDLGIWRETSWLAYQQRCKLVAYRAHRHRRLRRLAEDST